MKSLSYLAIAFFAGFGTAFAQSSETITVEANGEIGEEVLITDQFRFTDFQPGKVHFKNGNTGSGKLNYNLLYDAVMFINPQGDTLALANPETIQHITIEGHDFYFDEGYFEVIQEYPEVKLALKQVLKVSNKVKEGAYGQKSNSAAIDTYSSMYANTQVFDLKTNEDVTFKKRSSLYLIDQNNRTFPATKRNVLKVHPRKHKKSIKKYLDTHKINFNEVEELNKLLEFASGLK